MILNCPSCTMRYLVSEGAIGPNGRTVRCAHCGHQWKQEPEEGLDEELFAAEASFGEIPDNFVETMGDEDDEAAFEPAHTPSELPDARDADFQSILQKELEDKPIPAGVLPVHEHEEFILPTAKSEKKGIAGDRLAGFATAAGIFFVVFMGFLLMQAPISRAWPPSNLLYDLVGMKPVMPGEGLSLEGLNAEMKDGKILMSGSIVNLKDVDLTVPAIMATIVDQKDEPIDRVLIAPPVSRLKKEGQVEFDAVYPKMPDGATNVTYAFSFIKTKSPAKVKEEVKEEHTEEADEEAHEEPVATPADAPTTHAPAQETHEEPAHEAPAAHH